MSIAAEQQLFEARSGPSVSCRTRSTGTMTTMFPLLTACCFGHGRAAPMAGFVALVMSPVLGASEGLDRVPAELRSCVAIEKNSERLACFDRGIALLASDRPQPIAAPAPSAESMFGLPAAAPAAVPAAGSAAVRQTLTSITARVRSIRREGDGLWRTELDNGQTWRELAGRTTLLLAAGDEVTINRGVLGSFSMVTPSGRSLKVNRVR